MKRLIPNMLKNQIVLLTKIYKQTHAKHKLHANIKKHE